MTWRTGVHLLLLPVLVGIYAFAHYGFRAGLYAFLIQDLGLAASDLVTLLSIGIAMHLLGMVAAGVSGAVVGPHGPLVVGALGGVLATGLLPTQDPDVARLAVWGEGFASGVVVVSLWSLALVQLEVRYRYARLAFLTLLFVAIDLGALGSSFLARFGMGFGPFYLPLLGLAFVAMAVGWKQRWPEPPSTQVGRSLLVAAGVAVLTLPSMVLGSVAGTASMLAMIAAGPSSNLQSTLAIGPLVAAGAGLLLAALWGIAQVLGPRIHDVVVLGLTIVAYAVSMLGAHSAAVALFGSTTVVGVHVATGLTDVVVVPLVFNRLGADQHWRLVPVLVAGWLGIRLLLSSVFEVASQYATTLDLPLLGVVSAAAAGGLVLALGGFSARDLLVPPDPSVDLSDG